MKITLRMLAAAILLAVVSSPLRAAEKLDSFGLGVVAGDTLGGSAKFWFDKYSAVDLAMGEDVTHGNFVVYGDYLYNGWKALPQPSSGKLSAYVGAGPRIEVRDDSTEFGIRAVLGASYWTKNHPFEFYAEVGPLLRMTPVGGVYIIGGVGARYYFKHWN